MSLSAHTIRALITARKKLVGQGVTIDNRIRGLMVAFGVWLPGALSPAFKEAAQQVSDVILGLRSARSGIFAACEAILDAIAVIEADMMRMTCMSKVGSHLMAVHGVGPITSLAIVAAIDDPSRISRSRDVCEFLGLVPR